MHLCVERNGRDLTSLEFGVSGVDQLELPIDERLECVDELRCLVASQPVRIRREVPLLEPCRRRKQVERLLVGEEHRRWPIALRVGADEIAVAAPERRLRSKRDVGVGAGDHESGFRTAIGIGDEEAVWCDVDRCPRAHGTIDGRPFGNQNLSHVGRSVSDSELFELAWSGVHDGADLRRLRLAGRDEREEAASTDLWFQNRIETSKVAVEPSQVFVVVESERHAEIGQACLVELDRQCCRTRARHVRRDTDQGRDDERDRRRHRGTSACPRPQRDHCPRR